MEAGILSFKAIDVQEPGNRHFVKDFGLYGRSVAVAGYRDGKVTRYKLLPEAWLYAKDPQKLEEYILHEISAFMKEGDQ